MPTSQLDNRAEVRHSEGDSYVLVRFARVPRVPVSGASRSLACSYSGAVPAPRGRYHTSTTMQAA